MTSHQVSETSSSPSSTLAGKLIVVTGGSSGIGWATARQLTVEGARVVVFARESEALRAVGAAPGIVTVAGDVTKREDVESLFRLVQERYGRLDGLFVNAGIAEFAALEDADEAQYERLFATNVRGAFLTTKYAARLLGKGSSIVFTSSVAAEIGAPLCSLYGATKGAVTAFARNMAAEFLARGVRVNVMSPGPTETPIQSKAPVSPEGLARMAPFVMARLWMGRMGQPDEVARLACFLLSDASSFIHGQTIAVDGGMAAL